MTTPMHNRRRSFLALAAGLPLLQLARARQAAPREIEITAQRFRFTPNVIALKVDEPVVLQVKALDFAHGFYVPDLDRRLDLMPGRAVAFAFTPTAPGTLHFLCDNFCGDHHEDMNGTFIVE